MKNKFELSIMLGLVVSYIQLLCGHTHHAFYSLGGMMVIIMIGIMSYLREIFLQNR